MPSEQMQQIPLMSADPNITEWRATETRGATGRDQFSSKRCPPAARCGKLRTPNSALRTFLWSLPFVLAGLCFWQALPGPRTGSPPSATAATASVMPTSNGIAAPARKRTLITRPIQDIRPGMRVIAKNPELHGHDVPEIAIVPEDTRLVSLHMVKPDGHELTIETLLPLDSLCVAVIDRIASDDNDDVEPRPLIGTEEDVFLNEVLIGYEFELQLAELGVEGPAAITSIRPCPPIEPDDGTGRRLVTSVFRHAAANVIDLSIGSSDQSIGVTANHPFWSEDRQSFIPAGELRPGENLRKADGTLAQVTRINPRRGPPVTVFNFEVEGQHVYSVGSDGLLVHNDCKRLFITYTGIQLKSGLPYVGRASGFGTPEQILARRLSSHHITFVKGSVIRDKFSTGYAAIRGREQLVLEKLLNAGKVANDKAGISDRNKNLAKYLGSARRLWGNP